MAPVIIYFYCVTKDEENVLETYDPIYKIMKIEWYKIMFKFSGKSIPCNKEEIYEGKVFKELISCLH